MVEFAKQEPFQSSALLKQLMAEYYCALRDSQNLPNNRIAWCSSVGPAELLRSMGFLVYFPENHGAMLGATRLAAEYIPVSNSFGYSPDVCSYLTSDIGAYFSKSTPLTKSYGLGTVPKPDVLVYNTNQCTEIQDWFAFYSREWNVPLLGIHSPRGLDIVNSAYIRDVVAQFQALVPILESISQKPFDIDKLRETLRLSRDCSLLWKSVLDSCSSVPSPFTFFDATIHMAPAVVLRGTQAAVSYYKELLTEMNSRIAQGIASVKNEKFRLYWDGMPIWGRLRGLADQFSLLNTSIPVSTYCNSWVFDAFDPKKPFESMAQAYLELFIVRSEVYKKSYIEERVKRFKIDGIIFHDSKTCSHNTNSRFGLPKRISDELNIPNLIIHGDLNDLRLYSEEQTKTSIEAFIEQLEL